MEKKYHCNCKTGCQNNRCSCLRNTEPCDAQCGCTDCRNPLNKVDVETLSIGAIQNIEAYKALTNKHRRNIRYGNNLYREILIPGANTSLRITGWDLWMVIVLVDEFDSDWDKLSNHLRAKKRGYSFQQYKAEELLNHLYLLRQTLDRAGLSLAGVLAEANRDFLQKQGRKARRKVLEMSYQDQERSPWMIHTPRKEREERALRGYWGHFPMSPDQYAHSLASLFKSSDWYKENQTFALKRKLLAFVEKNQARALLPELCALHRAFLTVVIEKMIRVDDSYGVIGDLYEDLFVAYVQLDRSALDMPLDIFFQDLLELLIWEDYGFTYQKQPDFFAGLAGHEVPIAESILQEQWEELGELELDYQTEKTLTMLGRLYTQQRMFDKFVPAAQMMGTHAWERITTMSEMAEKYQWPDLALAVYKACLRPGNHEDHLRKKYQELQDRLASVLGHPDRPG